LSRYYSVEGMDLDYEMVKLARKNNPALKFHFGDMVDFHLGRSFDVLTCLFSSIGYVQTKTRLRKAIQNMADHLAPGGILIVEPWFTPQQWSVGHIGLLSVERADHSIVRMSRSGRSGNVSVLTFEYLIGTARRIEHRSEIHKLGLFTDKEYRSAFEAAALEVFHDPQGLDGRGLYIGRKEWKKKTR
jgi:SAM-dependent methyltransferase